MASVFTFETETLRLSSPWGHIPSRDSRLDPSANTGRRRIEKSPSIRLFGGLNAPPTLTLEECGMMKLDTEPHEGSTEYKLHLLLRQRRSFKMISACDDATGLQEGSADLTISHRSADSEHFKRQYWAPASSAPTTESRQNRLQHLTTQLLWRLQQSSPYHSSSAANLVIPQLPEAITQLHVPQRPAQLLPGLESSQGALYEIGVADDGTFVGLREDEMSESLVNLRAMAASLGCNVDLVRLVIVGEFEWPTQESGGTATQNYLEKGNLYVAEALVLPETRSLTFEQPAVHALPSAAAESQTSAIGSHNELRKAGSEVSRTEQLRVSLTGRTTAGKSSLLGTVSTSTFDNGRGKSRLSLLKHRHEIATGMTSSVAPELIGYTDSQSSTTGDATATVINYSSINVSSWDDIHSSAEGGRLVFLADSAGHHRYRRTIVRGLLSWAPHWTLCCIPADENVRNNTANGRGHIQMESSDEEDIARSSFAHLGLCLKLKLSLIVVITKQDHATRDNLRLCLSSILSMIKACGKRPNLMIRPGSTSSTLDSIGSEEIRAGQAAFIDSDSVPIILTSAVTGQGIGRLHALLRTAPLTAQASPSIATPPVLFHVDEIYSLPHNSNETGGHQLESLVIVSGFLRYGTLSIGDLVHVGPFLAEAQSEFLSVSPHMERTISSPAKLTGSPLSRSSLATLRTTHHGSYSPSPSTPTAAPLHGSFALARIVSIRNLRLPVRTLLSDQVGTVGIEFSSPNQSTNLKLRKGMVLARTAAQIAQPSALHVDPTLRSCTSIQVRFQEEDYEIMEPGAIFNVYIASVRAVAKILTVEAVSQSSPHSPGSHTPGESLNAKIAGSNVTALHGLPMDGASFDDGGLGDLEETFEDMALSSDDLVKGPRMIDVVFNFLYYAEWIEIGAQVLAMPSQTIAGGIGLDGFVGYVVESRE